MHNVTITVEQLDAARHNQAPQTIKDDHGCQYALHFDGQRLQYTLTELPLPQGGQEQSGFATAPRTTEKLQERPNETERP